MSSEQYNRYFSLSYLTCSEKNLELIHKLGNKTRLLLFMMRLALSMVQLIQLFSPLSFEVEIKLVRVL